MRIPQSPEAITAEWLTAVLQSSKTISKAAVKSFTLERIGEKEGFTGFLVRLRLDYTFPEENAPVSLIGKFSPETQNLRSPIKENGIREIGFYSTIAAGQRLPVPYCYYTASDPDTGVCILLLEDLSHLRSVNFLTGCTREEAERAVRGLASIHAAWWGNPDLLGMDWMLSFADLPFQEWWVEYPGVVKALLPDFPYPKALFEIGDRIASNIADILPILEDHPYTCIHRDVHVDNLLFGVQDSDPQIVVVDWQAVGRGRGAIDIGYFMISSLPPDLRRQMEKELLQVYHSLLLQSGVQGYSFDQCWLDYQRGGWPSCMSPLPPQS